MNYTSEHQNRLIELSQGGDDKALGRLFKENRGFVWGVAHVLARQHRISAEDMYGAGKIGFIEAVHRYDPEKNCKFISFAVWHVRNEMQQEVVKNSIFTTNRNILTDVKKLKNYLSEFTGEPPADDVIRKSLGFSEQRLSVARTMLPSGVVSLNKTGDFGDDFIETLRSDDETGVKFEKKDEIDKFLENVEKLLNPHDKKVLFLYFGIGGRKLSMQEIQDTYGIGRGRVGQIIKDSLEILKQNLTQEVM